MKVINRVYKKNNHQKAIILLKRININLKINRMLEVGIFKKLRNRTLINSNTHTIKMQITIPKNNNNLYNKQRIRMLMKTLIIENLFSKLLIRITKKELGMRKDKERLKMHLNQLKKRRKVLKKEKIIIVTFRIKLVRRLKFNSIKVKNQKWTKKANYKRIPKDHHLNSKKYNIVAF